MPNPANYLTTNLLQFPFQHPAPARFLEIIHIARHSFATILKQNGVNLLYIAEALGHSDIKSTSSYLASFKKEERMKNALILANVITGEDM